MTDTMLADLRREAANGLLAKIGPQPPGVQRAAVDRYAETHPLMWERIAGAGQAAVNAGLRVPESDLLAIARGD